MGEHDWHKKDLCEWDPTNNEPAHYVERPRPFVTYRQGCLNKATVLVGSKGDWRLCESCSKLKRFRLYRIRQPIAKPERPES